VLRRLTTRAATVAAVVAATVGGVAAPAWAPKYILGSSAFGRCVLPGGSEPLFQGGFTVLSFSASGGRLYATAAVSGACLDGLAVAAVVPPATYTFPVEALTADCAVESAVVEVRPGAATVDGVLGAVAEGGAKVSFGLDLYPSTVVDRIWMAGDPMSERARLCAVAKMTAHRSPAGAATALNALLLRG
jgi:hypothetical protein